MKGQPLLPKTGISFSPKQIADVVLALVAPSTWRDPYRRASKLSAQDIHALNAKLPDSTAPVDLPYDYVWPDGLG